MNHASRGATPLRVRGGIPSLGRELRGDGPTTGARIGNGLGGAGGMMLGAALGPLGMVAGGMLGSGLGAGLGMQAAELFRDLF